MRKQELIFAMLQACASRSGAIYGDGVLEILPDGYGFCVPHCRAICGPTIFMFPPLRFGAFICARVMWFPGRYGLPRKGNVISPLLKVKEIGFEPPENARQPSFFVITSRLFIPIAS